MRGSSAGVAPGVGRGTFLQQEKALAGGAEGVTRPDLQHSDLQVPNSLIPAPLSLLVFVEMSSVFPLQNLGCNTPECPIL